jgi:hypothetical protein
MNKTSLFQFPDIFIYFNIFIFISLGVFGFELDLVLAISLFAFGLFNISYLIYIFTLRHQLKIEINQRLQRELALEESKDDQTRTQYLYAKQVLLETLVTAEIEKCYPDAKIIKNAYIPQSSGEYSEIDIIAIHTSGIYILEVKNVTGQITGSWLSEKLVIKHPSGNTYTIVNPINQNTQHYYRLRDILGITGVFRNIIVFGDSAFYDYKGIPEYAGVTKVNKLARTMEIISNRSKKKIEQHQVESIYQTLLPIVTKTEVKQQKHIMNQQKNRSTT